MLMASHCVKVESELVRFQLTPSTAPSRHPQPTYPATRLSLHPLELAHTFLPQSLYPPLSPCLETSDTGLCWPGGQAPARRTCLFETAIPGQFPVPYLAECVPNNTP